MCKKFFKIFVLLTALIAVVTSVSADVSIGNSLEYKENTVYVAGHTEFFPIEYYNKDTNMYEGVMPEILKDVSEATGIDFVYIHRPELTQTMLAQDMQVEMVSAYIVGSKESYATERIKIFSYTANNQTVNVGIAFTGAISKKEANEIKKALKKITDEEIKGYFISSGFSNNHSNAHTIMTVVLLIILFGVIIGFVFYQHIRTKKQIKTNEMTDPETGLGNLFMYEQHFGNISNTYLKNLYYVSYIIIDSGYLQAHRGEMNFADAVKQVATVLSSVSGNGNVSARITESGFAHIYQSTNAKQAEEHIDSIMQRLNSSLNQGPVFRAAAYHLDQEVNLSSEYVISNLRRNCNKIMLTDKQYVFCDEKLMNSEIEERKLIDSFQTGIDNNEFKLYLQFVVENKTKKIVSAEALSRWENPREGLILPGRYIPAMENTGFISILDFYMFEQVCIQLHKWKDTEFDGISMSCNFTRLTLSESNFMEKIKSISAKYVFDHSRLIMEITEDTIEKNRGKSMSNVLECKKMGFRIALDDMGSGYTSLSNLCDYPIELVKIDRGILLKTDTDKGKSLYGGIVALAHSLNLKVICEGIETPEHRMLTENTNCDYIQGWYYSKPLPAKESEAFYHEYSHQKTQES